MGRIARGWLAGIVIGSVLVSSAGLADEIFLVAERPGVQKAVRQALVAAGHKVRVVNQEQDYFIGLSSLTTGNLGAPRPGFLTGPVLAAWDQGMAACRAKAGDPPWNMKNKHAFLCGRALGRVLWQRFLDDAKPDLVLGVTVQSNQRNGPVIVEAWAHGPAESVQRRLTSGPLPMAKVHPKAKKMALALVAGRGKSTPRAVERDLPEAPFSTLPGGAGMPDMLRDGQVLDLPAVALPPSCGKALPALQIEPSRAPLAETILKLYVKSSADAKRSGELLRCELGLSQYKVMAGTQMRRFDGLLRCGEDRYEAMGLGISPAHAHKKIAAGLVQALLRAACR